MRRLGARRRRFAEKAALFRSGARDRRRASGACTRSRTVTQLVGQRLQDRPCSGAPGSTHTRGPRRRGRADRWSPSVDLPVGAAQHVQEVLGTAGVGVLIGRHVRGVRRSSCQLVQNDVARASKFAGTPIARAARPTLPTRRVPVTGRGGRAPIAAWRWRSVGRPAVRGATRVGPCRCRWCGGRCRRRARAGSSAARSRGPGSGRRANDCAARESGGRVRSRGRRCWSPHQGELGRGGRGTVGALGVVAQVRGWLPDGVHAATPRFGSDPIITARYLDVKISTRAFRSPLGSRDARRGRLRRGRPAGRGVAPGATRPGRSAAGGAEPGDSIGAPTWTSPAARRSPPSSWSRGSSTCSRHYVAPVSRISCRPGGCCARRW
jgi:hypothetical protein